MKDREPVVLNCPRHVTVEPLEKGRIFGVVNRHCPETDESSNFLMVGGLAFCLKDCPQKKIIDKKLSIIDCPYEGVTFPIKVTKGKVETGEDEHFLCNQADKFTNITYSSVARGGGIAACGESKRCKIEKESEVSLISGKI